MTGFACRGAARSLGVGLGIVLFGLAREARADSGQGGVALNWVRLDNATECPFVETLASAVEQRIGRRIFVGPGEATYFVEGHVERTKDGYRARMRLLDRAGTSLGQRELATKDADCSNFNRELAFVVSLLVKDHVPPADPPPAPPPAPPAPVVESKPAAAETKTILVREEASVRVLPSIGGTVGMGWTPDLNPGVHGHLFLVFRDFVPVYVGGTYLGAPDVESGRARASMSTLLGHAGLCPLRFARDAIWLCGGTFFGAERSRGEGFQTNFAEDTLIVGAEVAARANLRIAGSLYLSLGVVGSVPFTHRQVTYVTAGREEVFIEGAAVRSLGEASIGWMFPSAIR